MIALVTGASSGIGRDIARSLAKHGINVIITARRRDRLEELKKELTETYGVKVHIIAADISDMAQCRELHRRVKKYSIDIFVNNAGLGVFGDFTDTDLDRELAELDVNVKAFHTLFKLFLQDFRKRDYGYILNTASSAGFFPGPHFSSYYASKAYVVRMTQAVHEELRAARSQLTPPSSRPSSRRRQPRRAPARAETTEMIRAAEAAAAIRTPASRRTSRA